MENIDNTVTEHIQSWLNEEHSSAEKIREGADLLLSLNRNRVLHGNIMNNPSRPMWKEKLEYELRKFLAIRLDGLTRNEVIRLDIRVSEEVKAILGEGTEETDDADGSVILRLKGRRQDHGELPDGIKRLFDNNHERYMRIRSLHATLRTMENAPSCDRYEYLRQLDELDSQYRENMAKYDGYVLYGSAEAAREGDHQTVTVNRTWISRNKAKLCSLKDSAGNDTGDMAAAQAYADFLAEFNAKVAAIAANGGGFKAKLKAELEGLGVTVPDNAGSVDDGTADDDGTAEDGGTAAEGVATVQAEPEV